MASSSFGARVISLSIIGLFALAALPLPGAQAQGLVDTDYRSESLLPGATTPVQVVTDPEDTGFALPDVAPVNPDYAAPADIISLSISETEDKLLFSLKARGYPEFPATTSEFVPTQEMSCWLGFGVNEGKTWFYQIGLRTEQFQDGGAYKFDTYAYRYTIIEEGRGRYYESESIDDVPAELIAGDHVETVLSKEDIFVGESGRALRAGDKITDIETYCFRSSMFFQSYFDYNQDGYVPYTIKTGSRSSELQVAFADEFKFGDLTIPAGTQTKVPVTISNLRTRNLLVNVTATLTNDDGQPLAGWSVKAPPTFELRGNNSLPTNLIITPPAGAAHRDGGNLQIRATALGFEKAAVAKKAIFATVDPSPAQNTLYFHNGPARFSCGFICGEGLPLRTLYFENYFFGNTLPTDPTFGETDVDNEGVAFLSDDDAFMMLDAPLSRPLRFDPEGLFSLQLSLKTDVPRDLRVTVDILGEEANYAYGEQTISATSEYSKFTIDFPTNLEALKVPAGQYMGVSIRVREAVTGFNPQGDAWISPVDWRPSETSISLPLVSVPQSTVELTDGRVLPSLALSNETSAEEYINPGQTQAFDMFLINEGTQTDVIGLKAEFDQPGWKIKYFPGERFDLRPGQSAPLCVSITAPDDALDADVVNVNLSAWSKADPAVTSATSLQLIVVDSIDIEPSSCVDRNDEDYVAPFTEDNANVPGAPLAFVLAVVGFLAAAMRRRL